MNRSRRSERAIRAAELVHRLESAQMRICKEAASVIRELLGAMHQMPPVRYGPANGSYRWSEDTVKNAMRMIDNGESMKSVSETLGVPYNTIKHWRKTGGR